MRAGVRDIVFSSSCSVYGTPGRGARRRVGADPARERLRRDARRWSSGSCTGTASPRACARSSLRYFNAAGASHDAVIGEDWDVLDQPRPARDEGGARRRAARQGVRRRLPDARRHVHPRLHPRRGPRRRPHQGARRARPAGPDGRSHRRQPRHRRRLVGARRHQGDRGTWPAGRCPTRSSPDGPATRSPRTPIPPYAEAVLGLAGRRRGSTEIVETAYRWHAKTLTRHPNGGSRRPAFVTEPSVL